MPSRRRVLTAGSSAAAAALAGCLGGMPDGSATNVGPPESTPDSDSTTIRYADVSDAEQAALDRGIDGGYRTCDDVPTAVSDLADRCNGPETYLRYDGNIQGLYLRIQDMIFADTTEQPPGDCSLL